MDDRPLLTGGTGDNTPVWFYVDGVLPQGPFTHAEIRKKFEDGEITANTTVYRNGEPNWRTLAKEPAFAYLFAMCPERAKTSIWRRGWLWMAFLFLLFAAYPILSTVVVQKDELEDEIKIAFVDFCNAHDFSLQRADVPAVNLTKTGDGRYEGHATVRTPAGDTCDIPLTVTVTGSPFKGRTITFTVEGHTDWLRTHF